MKKSLVLAMAMAMGVTASAYAANPFSDVPAGHWAYDSISKLASAGVVDGYGATFGGEKLMTRYEMAQIVAKAMAKGANVEKLAAEFADELDSLGVRVAKLEKKVDNVKVTGQIRFDYNSVKGSKSDNSSGKRDLGGMRNRIFVEGQINDNWTYTGMLQNYRQLVHSNEKDADGNKLGVDNDKIELKRAYLDGRLGGLKVRAGHWNEFFINEAILDDMIDGVQASYGFGKVNVYGLAGKFASDAYGSVSDVLDNARLYIAGASTKVGPVDFAFNYFKTHGEN
ncbi:MAG: S-layer homology domain-containing protein, partial [Acidaminococcaceae bacterium]|nr:S-layer homology domain-containing protein [Acidaminococcaceae bacterium]